MNPNRLKRSMISLHCLLPPTTTRIRHWLYFPVQCLHGKTLSHETACGQAWWCHRKSTSRSIEIIPLPGPAQAVSADTPGNCKLFSQQDLFPPQKWDNLAAYLRPKGVLSINELTLVRCFDFSTDKGLCLRIKSDDPTRPALWRATQDDKRGGGKATDFSAVLSGAELPPGSMQAALVEAVCLERALHCSLI